MFIRQHAFTLSELLVSLSVLGLIAALTLPSIFNSIETQKKKAVFKESFHAVYTVFNDGIMSGEITNNTTLQEYFQDHLAYVEWQENCPWNPSASYSYTTRPCFRLANGAEGYFYNGSTPRLTIDYNGDKEPNTRVTDGLSLHFNYGPTNTATATGRPLRVGEIQPYNTTDEDLYNSIL